MLKEPLKKRRHLVRYFTNLVPLRLLWSESAATEHFMFLTVSATINQITLNPNFYGRPHPPSKIKGIYTHSTMRIYAFFHTNIKQLAAKSTYPPTASPWASNPGYTSSRLPHKVPYALPLSHY